MIRHYCDLSRCGHPRRIVGGRDGAVYKSVTGQVSRLWRGGSTPSVYWHYGRTPRHDDGDRLTVLWVRLWTGKK